MARRNNTISKPVDAIEMLIADHQKVQALFAQYESKRDFSTKQHIAEQVFTELELHAQVEETVFYPAFEEQAGKKGKQLIADSRQEHENIKELITELQGLDIADEAFEAKFHQLMHNVRHHVEEEEDEMFPEAEEVLAEQLEDLMDEMQELKQQLTTS
jgi:hemerythrin superfamily protein